MHGTQDDFAFWKADYQLSEGECEGKGILWAAVGAILLSPVHRESASQAKNSLDRESSWAVFWNTIDPPLQKEESISVMGYPRAVLALLLQGKGPSGDKIPIKAISV